MEMQWDHAIDGERIGPGSTPMLSLKVAYFLTDTTAPDCGAMKCVPGSHLSDERPDGEHPSKLRTCSVQRDERQSLWLICV